MPGEGSFAMHAILANHYLHGASYPRGGASEIAFHIIPVIEKAGGKVLVRATVSKILVDENSGKVKGEAQYCSKKSLYFHLPLKKYQEKMKAHMALFPKKSPKGFFYVI